MRSKLRGTAIRVPFGKAPHRKKKAIPSLFALLRLFNDSEETANCIVYLLLYGAGSERAFGAVHQQLKAPSEIGKRV